MSVHNPVAEERRPRRASAALATAACVLAVVAFALGTYVGAGPSDDGDARIADLQAQIEQLRRERLDPALVEDVKSELTKEMGLFPLDLLRRRGDSFVELYAYDDRGGSSYGTAGHLGHGYFLTVKHAVIALDDPPAGPGRRIVSLQIRIKGRPVAARVVDVGDAHVEVHPGDWAILHVSEPIDDVPPLPLDVAYPFGFADRIFRLGNDYSKGIIVSTGHIGQRTAEGLVTSLTDGHPGASGGGVLNHAGELVGISTGRMPEDYRFAFILPIRQEMFRSVPFLN